MTLCELVTISAMSLSRNQIQVIALIAVSILANVTMGGGRVTASLFMLEHTGSKAMAGIAYSGYSLLPALLSLLMGRWIDRVGTRRVMHTAQLIMLGGLVLAAALPWAPTVLMSAVVCGFGFASFMLAANVAVSLMPVKHEGERVGMLGWLAMGGSVSSVSAPAMSGFVLDHWGFSAAYGVLAVCVLASLVLARFVPLPGGNRPPREEKAKGESVVRMVFSDPGLLRIYLLAMVVSMAYDGFAFMTPVLGHERGFSATTIGMILSAFAMGTFAVRALMPWLSRRFNEWRMMTMAFGLTATVFLLLPFASHGAIHAVLGFCFGLAGGVGQPNILSLVYRAMPPSKAGEGEGLRSMMGNAIGLTAPSAYGAIAALFGAVPVFVIIGSVAGIASWQADRGFRRDAALRQRSE
ncbi:MAG: hypothetical protein CGU28_02240 [Candidatus Dactylopiibacterium carminicum]|nr:MAG: hypothetical protein CGU28_02240 [Candidatus Dactylopiibacterium carminicum]